MQFQKLCGQQLLRLVVLWAFLALFVSFPIKASASAPTNVSFTSCSAQEATKIEQSVAELISISSNAVTYFNNNRAGNRFTSYFGAVNNVRWSTVKAKVNALNNAFLTSPLLFNCSRLNCSAGVFSYVYPTQHDPYEVFLCDAFFSAPTSGTDSSAGTLVHEISHFNSLASTSDYVFGKSGAQALAISNPGQAIQNADNYEYFFEDNPTTTDNASAYTLSATSLTFVPQIVNSSSAPSTVTLTNSGDSVLAIGVITPSSTSYTLSGSCQNTSVGPNQTCTISATFTPLIAGTQSATIAIASNAPLAMSTIELSGTSTAAPTTTLATTTTTSTTLAPAKVVKITVRAVSSASKLSITLSNNPTGTKRSFAVEKKIGSRWITQGAMKFISTKSVTINYGKGTYRVRLLPNSTSPGITSSSATLKK